MVRGFSVLSVIVGLLFLSVSAQAQLLMNPVGVMEPGQVEASFGGGLFEQEYEGEDDALDVLSRNHVYSSLAVALTKRLTVSAGAAYSFNSTVDGLDDEGSGTIFGAGLQVVLWRSDRHHITRQIVLYGEFLSIDEELSDETRSSDGLDFNFTAEVTGEEVVAGVLYSHTDVGVTLFGGLEVIPISELTFEGHFVGVGFGGFRDEVTTFDTERHDILSVKLGASIDWDFAEFFGEGTITGLTKGEYTGHSAKLGLRKKF